jgi:hypothetical protein
LPGKLARAAGQAENNSEQKIPPREIPSVRIQHLALAALISALVIGGSVAVLTRSGSSNGKQQAFSALASAPRDVDFVMSINTDSASSQWISFSKRLKALNADEPIRDSVTQELETEGLRWDRDVLSVLGKEGYIAVTDFSNLGEQKGAVAAFQLRDPTKARQNFLKIARSSARDADETLLEENYQGVTITYAQEKFGSGRNRSTRDFGAIAFPGELAVLGLSRDDVKGVIDVIQGRSPSIAQNSRFQEMRARQKDDFLFWGYADLVPFWKTLEDSTASMFSGSTPQTAAALKEARDSADRFAFSFSAQGQGLVVDAQVLRTPGAPPDPTRRLSQQLDPALARLVPSDTILLIAGANAHDQLFSSIQKAAANDRDFDRTLKQLENDIGFHLDSDLFALMTGEYGLAANFGEDGGPAGFSILGLFNIADATKVSRSLDLLGRYLSREAGVTATQADRNGVRRLSADGETIAWKATDKTLVAGYPDAAVQNFASPVAGKTLADTADWKHAMTALPSEKSYVAYLNLARLLQEADDAGALDTQAGPRGLNFSPQDLRPIRSFAMSGSSLPDGQRLRMVLLMDK